MKRKIKLIKHVRLWGLFFFFAVAAAFISFDIIESYMDFNTLSDKMRSDYVEQQKQLVKQEVKRVVEQIITKTAAAYKLAKIKTREMVYLGNAVALNIYNRNSESKAVIQKMIIDALQPVRFENKNSCYFITNLDGSEILSAANSKTEESNLLNIHNAEGRYIAKNTINITRSYGEGFYEYNWGKPEGGGSVFKKIAFVKVFQPYNWLIGTSFYKIDVEKRLKNELLDSISRIRFGREGYIFVNKSDGSALVANGKKIEGERKLWEVFNKNPESMKDLFNMEYNASLKPEGGFIYYSFVKFSDSTIKSPKVSFIYGLPDLQWVIGAGVYLDDVEKEISVMRSGLMTRLRLKSLYSLLVIIGIMALFLVLFSLFTRRVKNDIMLFTSFFSRAAFSSEPMELDKVQFVEFEHMAENANTMLKDKIEAQQELERDKEQYRTIAEDMPVLLCSFLPSGEIVYVNSAYCSYFGQSGEELIGKTMLSHIVKEDRKRVMTNISALTIDSPICVQEHHAIIPGGEIRLQRWINRALFNHYKYPVIYQSIGEDITDQKRAEQERLKLIKLESLGVLAGGIAHDFNNILTGLFGNIELALLKIPGDHPAHTYMETAFGAIEKATGLTRQLLTFAKGGDPILERVNLSNIVTNTVKFNLSGSNIKARIKMPENLWQVKGDQGQISQVVANLVINAKQAMVHGGTVYVEAENTEISGSIQEKYGVRSFVKLLIRDEGEGIKKENIGRIFDPYFTTKVSGNGLGLAAVYSIISKHKGTITVESTPGAGTVFTICLPAEETSSDFRAQSEQKGNQPFPALNILVMDDEEIVRNVIFEMVKSFGNTVDFALNGKEVIEKYQFAIGNKDPYDLIIMDLTIPGGMGGVEAVSEILKVDPQVKVIVSSGYSDDPVMANYTDYGFAGCLVKPYKIEALIKELSRVVKGNSKTP